MMMKVLEDLSIFRVYLDFSSVDKIQDLFENVRIDIMKGYFCLLTFQEANVARKHDPAK